MPEGRTQPWLLYGLIAANAVVYGIELAAGINPASPSPQLLIDLGGNYPPLTLHGEWWRLVSSMFLHGTIVHVALNMLCLYQVRAVEPMFGRIGSLVLYVLAGLGGGIASLLANSGNVVVTGASGAVFGLYGAAGAELVLHRARYEPEVWQRTFRRLATFLVINAVFGLSVSGVSVSSHIGGLIVGTAVAVALLAGAGAEQARVRRALGLALVGLALTAVGVVTIKADADVTPLLHRFDTLERAVPATTNAAFARYKAGELTAPDFVGVIERDALAPYRQLQRDLATTEAPARLRPLFARIDELVTARIAAFQTFQAVVAEPDPAKLAPLNEAHSHAEAEVTRIGAAVTAEVEALKGR